MTRERMSGADQAWLRMDAPENRLVIVGVWIFDGPLDREALERRIRERLLRHARFRQRVVEEPSGHFWVDDDGFSLDHHLVMHRWRGGPEPRRLRALIARLAIEPLDPARPLWRFDLVGDDDGPRALIARIHHCIADGIALVGVTLSLADGWQVPGAMPASATDPRHREDQAHGVGALIPPLTGGAMRAVHRAGRALGTTFSASLAAASDESARQFLVDAGLRVISDALKIALMADDSPTPLKGRPRGRKAVAWNDPIPLDEVKAVCKVLGVSVNDVLLSCVAGAIHHYLESLGHDTAGEEIRVMVPVNLRPPEAEPELGNHFGLVPLVLPVGLANPVERLFEVCRRMGDLKDGYQGMLAFALLSAMGHVPAPAQRVVLEYLANKGTAVMTNVPGPTQALRLLGRRVDQAMFWVPQSGTIGLGVSVFSYAGGVQFGVIADTAICPRPQAIVDRFAPEFERLLLTLSLLPRALVESGRIDPREVEHRLLGAGAGPSLRRAGASRPRNPGPGPVSGRPSPSRA
jgi:WS/DGAT/MGAT family acyltransferase